MVWNKNYLGALFKKKTQLGTGTWKRFMQGKLQLITFKVNPSLVFIRSLDIQDNYIYIYINYQKLYETGSFYNQYLILSNRHKKKTPENKN